MVPRAIVSVIALVLLAPAAAGAQLRAELVAQGLSQPVAFAQDPSNPAVQLVAEQAGRLRVLVNGALQPADFLDLRSTIASGGERGLLGVAYSPDFAIDGRVFVSFTNLDGNSVIARFTRSAGSPLVGDPATRFDLRWPDGNRFLTQPFSNHNGGNIAFGPDNYLYIGFGDGGSGNDPNHNAQSPSTLLGKMLRIDVSVPDSDPDGYAVPATNPFAGSGVVLPEIWAFGLRNPWRFSFDDPAHGGTGALVIADVGQNTWEEVDYEPAGAGGRNYGWRNREAAHANVTTLAPFSTPLVDPIHEYDHTEGRSIIGGYVYRGTALGSSYVGRYFFGDIVLGRIWSLGLQIDSSGEATATALLEHTAELGEAATAPSSFGVDASGEIYVLAYGTGRIYRLASTSTPGGTSGCPGPDPFESLGGGTCSGDGWLPPGYGAPPAAGSTPPPTTGGSTPPPTTGGCVTPDPFVILGGGTCVNGDWLPPGLAPPASGGSTGSGAGSGSSTGSGSTSGGCATPDPFVILGGGTCVNGDWLPPGMTIPGTGGSGSSGSGSSSSGGSGGTGGTGGSGNSSPGGCTTPDPFVILGGGTCVNGDWLPPGYPN